MENLKKILWGIFAVVLVVVAIIWFIKSDLKHIEDTNGTDDYSLTTITDENIINMDMGALGGPNISQKATSGDIVEFSSNKFTGVYEIFYDNLVGKSDFDINLITFDVKSGNFKMVVVHDDKIVATLDPNESVDYCLKDVDGTVSLRIAGESASFSFSMAEIDYDLHSHSE